MFPTRPTTGRPRGVAMLIVVTILVTMVLVALPFALSMRQGQERTQANVARGRARYEANLLADMVKLWLVRTHPYQEQLRRQRGETSVDANPQVDDSGEFQPNDLFRRKVEEEILTQWQRDPAMAQRAAYLKSRGLGPMNDDRGSIWSVQVEDAQALVNVNGASPFLLGNLLGSAMLTDDLDTGGGDIPVENVVTGRFGGLHGFARDGGFIRIGREVISYEQFDGQAFRGCQRGMLQQSPLGDNGGAESHPKGEPVIDYTAYKLATHIFARQPGTLTRFENLEGLRDISSWGSGGALTADRVERLLPYLTVWGRREVATDWIADQVVMNELPTSVDGDAPDELQLRDYRENPSGTTAYYNAGTLVRLSDGVEVRYGTVAAVGDASGRRTGMFLTLAGRVDSQGQVTFKGGETRVSAFAPYPIDINTASQEVLYAVMANLRLLLAKEKDQIVHPELAWQLAGEIVADRKGALNVSKDTGQRQGGPFRNAEDWGRWLNAKQRTGELTRAQVAALYLNAINPHSSTLRFGTAPWCFRTLDVYHVEARVALNNRAGEQIAEAAVREVVEIGSDTSAIRTLDSQDDFERPLAMGAGGKWYTTYPFAVGTKVRPGAHHIQPAMRGPKSWSQGVFPSDTRSVDPVGGQGADVGDVRLEPARLLLPGAQVEKHFDSNWYTDGHYTEYDRAYLRRTRGTLMGRSDKMVQPFAMSFWWRPYSHQDWTVFDVGKEQFMNRVAVFLQPGAQGQELTFRCSAGTLWKQGAEVYVPLEQLDYKPGTWYHIHVSCAGEDPSTMQMLVDGVDLGMRRGLTVLSGSVLADGEELTVESTAGFPVRGAIRIGTEIVEYDTRTETSFRDCVRGARGTKAQDWQANTPVHVLGYSMPVKTDIRMGGCSLSETLKRWTAVRVSTITGGNPATDEIPWNEFLHFRGFGPDRKDITVSTVAIWDQDIADAQEAFGSKGLALLGCPRPEVGGATQSPASPDVKFGGWEVVYYERSGSDFTITRYKKSAWQGEAAPYFLMTEVVEGNAEYPAFLVPISVLVTGQSAPGQDYLDPGDLVDAEILTRYADSQAATDASARILIGTDTPQDAHEVIRYDSIERHLASPGILFVRDRSLSRVTAGFFGQPRGLSGGTAPPPDTDPPVPPDTEPPVPPDPDPTPVPDPTPGDPNEPADPTPGGGVPPGLRSPQDPPTTDPGEPVDPGTGDPGTGEPGTGDPGTGDPSSGSGSDGSDGSTEEPTDSSGGDFKPPEGETDQPTDGAKSGGSASGEDDAPDDGTVEGNPPEEEPMPDESGGGGDYGGDETDDKNDSAKVPSLPDAGARAPTDPPQRDDGAQPGPNSALDPHNVWPGHEDPENIYTYDEALDDIQFRGVNTTNFDDRGGLTHSGGGGLDTANSRVLPCFRVWETFRAAPVSRVGRNDVLTLTDGTEAATRMEMGVRWGDEASEWCALVDFLPNVVPAEKTGGATPRNDPRGHARVLKFPSGELPDEIGEQCEWGQSTISGAGLVRAFLDELFVWRQALDTTIVVNDPEGVTQQGDEIRLARTATAQDLTTLDGYDKDCGLLLLEGELIIYRGSRTEGDTELILERCVRGQMGTRPTAHPRGAQARFLADIPVSYLEGGLTADAASISLARTAGWPREGLMRIVRDESSELVHYTRLAEHEALMPTSLDADERTRDRGLFRGRFGTAATEHDNDEVVVFQPFRYWDRYTPRRSEDENTFGGVHDHPEASFLELGNRAHTALWRGFTWSQNLTGFAGVGASGPQDNAGAEGGLLDILVLARFNRNVPWDTPNVVDMRESSAFGRRPDLTSRRDSHLFLFDGPGSTPMGAGLDGNLLDVEADAADFRVYFQFKPNAFVGVDGARRTSSAMSEQAVLSNTWKMTPWLQSFSVGSFSRTELLHRATLR